MIVWLLITGGPSYTVTAKFENASQVVKGNNVTVAGATAGSVKDIRLEDDGQAAVELEINEAYAPLKQGTTATIRSQSLSGIANRFVELGMPPADAAGEEIEKGGTIEQANTVSEVDLDELFNTLDKPTIEGFKGVIKGFARAYDGVGPQANKGYRYLNPFLSTSRRVFGELNADQPALERLIVDSASLTSNLAAVGPDISALIHNLNGMLGAIGRQDLALAEAVGGLPDFMRQFNTTGVNLRAALDDLDPLVNASKPVARKLKPFARQLRGFARDAVPTVKDLDAIVYRPGGGGQPGTDNDLIDLTQLQVPLGEIGVGPVNRNGASQQGALPASSQALTDGLPALSFLRPYIAQEGIGGWFDDFGHSGFPDAIGGIGRILTTFNVFTVGIPGFPGVPDLTSPATLGGLDIGNVEKCPGSGERGVSDAQLTQNGTIDCDPSQTPPGN
jgi:phospholipid/cholesterol/gamma-HCH transport system substrate-binding protein